MFMIIVDMSTMFDYHIIIIIICIIIISSSSSSIIITKVEA